MNPPKPPPLPKRQPARREANGRFPVILATAVGVFVVVMLMLRLLGLVQPFSVPTRSMSPAISPGDHIVMESISFFFRNPRKGDIVVFKSDGIQGLIEGATYTSRIAGVPGEGLRIADGKLYVNEAHLALRNEAGEIRYVNLRESQYLASDGDRLTIPGGQYFVLGDNSTNSRDGRFWGFLPARNIKGRVAFCFWPLQHAGTVK